MPHTVRRRSRIIGYLAAIVDEYRVILILKLVVFLIVIWVAGATWLYVCERNWEPTPEQIENGELNWFNSYSDSVRHILVYLFSGFEQYEPHTFAGWFGSIIVMVLGSFGLLALLIGNVSSIIQERVRRAGFVKSKPSFGRISGHIIICNWNEKAPQIIRHLRTSAFGPLRPIVIVSESANEISFSDKRLYRQVWAVNGDPRDTDVLKSADIEYAYTALILADKAPFQVKIEPGQKYFLRPEDSIDSRSTLIAKSIEAIHPTVHTVIDLVDPHNVKRFATEVVDEVIAIEEFTERLIARSAQTHGMSNIFSHFISPYEGTNEIYRVPVPRLFIGKSYHFVRSELLKQENEDLVPIGFWSYVGNAERIVINPSHEVTKSRKNQFTAHHKLKAEDTLILIAYGQPALEAFQ